MIELAEIKRQVSTFKDAAEFFSICNQAADPSIKNWAFATLDLEKSLDTFMQQLAAIDKMTALHFASLFAQFAFKFVADSHLEQIKEFGLAFFADDPCQDGEPIEKQIENVADWLKNPSAENLRRVQAGIDPSRQLNIWEEDLFPPDDQMWEWILEVSQLLSMAVVAGDSAANDNDLEGSPYNWSYTACVSRSTICALKSIAQAERTIQQDITTMFEVIKATL